LFQDSWLPMACLKFHRRAKLMVRNNRKFLP